MNRDSGAGWIMYAWIVLIVLGVWNVIEGIVAISRSHFFTATGAHYVYSDLKTWGWIILIWGILEVLAAGSVVRGGQWGRWFGIFVAGIAIILQFLGSADLSVLGADQHLHVRPRAVRTGGLRRDGSVAQRLSAQAAMRRKARLWQAQAPAGSATAIIAGEPSANGERS